MIDLQEKYQELKVTAIGMMGNGNLQVYIEKLKELEVIKTQLYSAYYTSPKTNC